MSVRKLLDNQLEKLLKIVWITISKWKVLLMHILLKESVLYKNLHIMLCLNYGSEKYTQE